MSGGNQLTEEKPNNEVLDYCRKTEVYQILQITVGEECLGTWFDMERLKENET